MLKVMVDIVFWPPHAEKYWGDKASYNLQCPGVLQGDLDCVESDL